MTLSVDKLNLRSPYQLTQVNDLTFRFVTDQQINYLVGFYKDSFFMDEGRCFPESCKFFMFILNYM